MTNGAWTRRHLLLTFGGFYATLSLNNRTFLKIQNAGESNLVGFESTYDKISNYYTEAHERYNRFAEWDVYSVTDGQTYLQEIYGQLEISNYRIQLLGRETTTEEFPVIQNSSDQVKKLIDFALSPRGRNHLKNNYVRHMRGLTVLQKTKSEAIDLIQEIKMVLND